MTMLRYFWNIPAHSGLQRGHFSTDEGGLIECNVTIPIIDDTKTDHILSLYIAVEWADLDLLERQLI